MKKKVLFFMCILGMAIFVTGCRSLSPVPSPTFHVSAIYTQAAQTIALRLTLDAGQTAVAKLTEFARATPTPLMPPTATISPSPTDTTSLSTSTPPIPPTTEANIPCNWAEYLGEEPGEASVLQPGTRFTKTWRLKNNGSCAWTREYELVFFDGDQMGAPSILPLVGVVRPGEIVDISVDLIAPEEEGVYTGYWMLRSATGDFFGVGRGASESLWVQVKVRIPSDVVLSFVYNYCNAIWNTGAGTIPCPGSDEDASIGFVNLYDLPVLENGKAVSEPAIITVPDKGNKGLIAGRFPAFRVRAGDRFRTTIGCLFDSFACNVLFQLNYRANGGSLKSLDSWVEVYDGKVTRVDIDLTPLAGKTVEFILTVLNNGESQDDWAFWLNPVILR